MTYSIRYIRRRRIAALIIAGIVGFFATVTMAVSEAVDAFRAGTEQVQINDAPEVSATALIP